MEILKALNFNFYSFIWQIINLFVVIFLLHKIMYKPIIQMVAERERRIEGSLAEAAQAKEESGKLVAKYQAQLSKAREEAQDLINRATKAGEELKDKIINDAREEANKTVTRAKSEIEGEKAKALADIRDQAAMLAIMAAGRVLERSITADDQKRLAKKFISEVGELQ
jgi:F-type H+-transporting ATPase subunit b